MQDISMITSCFNLRFWCSRVQAGQARLAKPFSPMKHTTALCSAYRRYLSCADPLQLGLEVVARSGIQSCDKVYVGWTARNQSWTLQRRQINHLKRDGAKKDKQIGLSFFCTTSAITVFATRCWVKERRGGETLTQTGTKRRSTKAKNTSGSS